MASSGGLASPKYVFEQKEKSQSPRCEFFLVFFVSLVVPLFFLLYGSVVFSFWLSFTTPHFAAISPVRRGWLGNRSTPAPVRRIPGPAGR